MGKSKPAQKLVHEKKQLQKQLNGNSEHDAPLKARIAQIESALEAKTTQSDQNFFRVFYRVAKASLPERVFEQIESNTSTRQHNYQQKSAGSKNV
ncbi:Uncharacterised protein [Acinetobacter baumannii]|uniref:Uncharacterized protein n=1 Tax=Acinetobacter baumannii TaxID=470 RepID=A0A9P2LC62_ACIBA|nr:MULTISPECIES: hypothetical protein [Acinetobacter calcoaceticus/baumannii complex]EKT9125625.1 hypothetical protein [Acinetobacter baumannii]EKT9273326.1 hypothetical protein [Acinetobacter baumannii]EKT9294548.1 hypothetical protein [Acinetobacter baumannii]EKT9315383.1 hypothetical protein [Acinetobacter baumannii]EKU0110619.1 hypothetical protein [Acinetobacter baumannii]